MTSAVFIIEVDVSEVLSIGAAPAGEVRVVPFERGRFHGPELSGTLLPGGTDWQRVRSDGVLEIRAHYLLETDHSERIEVISEGLRAASPEVLKKLAAGDDVPADAYYFRTAIRLSTAAPRLARFNERLYIGRGTRKARSVEIQVFEVA